MVKNNHQANANIKKVFEIAKHILKQPHEKFNPFIDRVLVLVFR